MTEAIYQWMENIAFYFIFLSAVMNFIPDQAYRKYIRFFMGLLLMMLVLSPLLGFLQLENKIEDSFTQYKKEEEKEQIKDWQLYAEQLEEKYAKYAEIEEEPVQ